MTLHDHLQAIFGDRLAPDGSLVRDCFAAWFRDSAVRNADGAPLVVYHGTNQNILVFNPKRRGANTGSISSKVGFFFTEHVGEADEYATMSARKQVSNAPEVEANCDRLLKAIDRAYARQDFDLAEKLTLELEASEQEGMSGEERGANIMPVFLRIENPMVVDFKESVDLELMTKLIAKAKRLGHDGLKMINVFDPVGYERPDQFVTTQWVAFHRSQIKSAVGNSGAFNAADPDISDRKAITLANAKRARAAVASLGPSRPRRSSPARS